MDRKIKKNEAIDKKTDHRIKDGGDSKKFEKSQIMAEHNNMKVVYLERGDSGERDILDHREPQQIKLNNDRKKPHDDIKSKYLTHGTAEKDFPQKKTNVQGPINKDLLGKSHSEIRKRIRDKYTFKLNVPVNKSDHLSLYRNRKGGTIKLSCDGSSPPLTIKMPPDPTYVRPAEKLLKSLSEETPTIIEKQNRSSSTKTNSDIIPDLIPEKKPEKIMEKKPEKFPEKKPEKIPEKKPEKILEKMPETIPVKPDKMAPKSKKRRPIIKTIVSKTDSTRVFKAVTFVDQRNSTPLEIKIPGEDLLIKKQTTVSKYTETIPIKFKPRSNYSPSKAVNKSSKESVKKEEKPTVARRIHERKRGRRHRGDMSPESVLEPACPPTEVARWAPASISPQTKPYYEAWVDTTLTATSKKDKTLYEYQAQLLKSFKRALEERPKSPDLFYSKYADESYAGRIKIRQKDRRA